MSLIRKVLSNRRCGLRLAHAVRLAMLDRAVLRIWEKRV